MTREDVGQFQGQTLSILLRTTIHQHHLFFRHVTASFKTAQGPARPALGHLLPSPEPTLVEQHLDSDYLMAAQIVQQWCGWPVLYCQQSKQLPWAHCFHALSPGSSFSLEWFSGA